MQLVKVFLQYFYAFTQTQHYFKLLTPYLQLPAFCPGKVYS